MYTSEEPPLHESFKEVQEQVLAPVCLTSPYKLAIQHHFLVFMVKCDVPSCTHQISCVCLLLSWRVCQLGVCHT